MLTSTSKRQYAIGISLVVLAAVGLYVVLPQVSSFNSSWDAVRQASAGLLLAALGATLLASVCTAVVIGLLSYKRLRLGNTILVQLSGLFVNRILPAGIGGLGLNYLYLRASRHTKTQATTIAALVNTLGFVGHMLLAAIIITVYAGDYAVKLPDWRPWLPVILGIIAALFVATIAFRHYFSRAFANVRKQLKLIVVHHTRRPNKMLLVLLFSCAMTMCNVVALWLCCQALGISINLLVVFLVFTFGVAAGTATPTPGGLGGVEAGITAGLVSQGVALPTAFAAALVFRLVSYWCGLLIGIGVLIGVQRRHLLG